jgi:hypothetical protein
VTRPTLIFPLKLPSLPTSLLLASAAVGFVVLATLAALTVLPLLVLLGGALLWIVSTLLLAWAGIEALAACERWMERNPRFQR